LQSFENRTGPAGRTEGVTGSIDMLDRSSNQTGENRTNSVKTGEPAV